LTQSDGGGKGPHEVEQHSLIDNSDGTSGRGS
jgi:hypothetical protein